MRRTYAWALCCVLALLLVPARIDAANIYDPAINYRTVYSPRFAVHYPPGAYNLAIRISRMSEQILLRDAALLRFMPKGVIDIVLTDAQDDANGSAEVLPHNVLRLQLAAPTELTGLASYDDWLGILLTHELSHIVDIDHTAGPSGIMRKVFGKLISFNGSVPQYLSEGVAVWAETKLSATGRGRSSYVDMVLRMAALQGKFVHIDQAHILFSRYPFGNAAYFYGGRFHLYLSKRLGDASVAALHHYYAAQPLPWIYGFGARAVYGVGLPQLWRDFQAEETALAHEVAANVRRDGLTCATRIFGHAGDITGARFYRGGHSIVYAQRSPEDGSTVRRFDLGQRRKRGRLLFRDTSSLRFALDPLHGDDFVYAMQAITHRFDTFGDLFLYDAGKKRRTRLFDQSAPRRSLRARDPSISADGQRLVFVQTHLQQSWLSVASLSRRSDGSIAPALTPRRLCGPTGEMQYATPAFSPDGRSVAVSTWFAGGKRDILLLDSTDGHLLRRVTSDTAQDGNPAWSPDGQYVLYESDADGISNLYAYAPAAHRYWRITRVIGGAFAADVSADGQQLLFRQAHGDGFEVRQMAFVPHGWTEMRYDPEHGYTPLQRTAAADGTDAQATRTSALPAWMTEALPTAVPRAAEPTLTLAANEHEGPYTPWRTLLPFHDNWLLIPEVGLFNNDPTLSLTTLGTDTLRYHTWALTAGSSYYARRPNVAISYSNDRFLPTYGASAGYTSVLYRTLRGPAVESSAAARASVALPWGRRHQVRLGYSFEHRHVSQRGRRALPSGRFASASLTYSYNFSRSFAYSISRELGKSFALSGNWFSRHLGGQHDQLILGADARAFVANPWFVNHVLALRASVNWAIGKDASQVFFLYGTQANSFFTQQSSRLFALRGFMPGTRFGAPTPGDGLIAAYVEYRLPLWHIQRGFYSWPIFFEHLHLGLFADLGNTGNTTGSQLSAGADATVKDFVRHMWAAAGAELRLDFTLAWAVPLTVRLGAAQPAMARGQRVVDRATPHLYIDLGTLF